jgi:SAM-dependent methyltransferase
VALSRTGAKLREAFGLAPTALTLLNEATHIRTYITRQAVRVAVTLDLPDLIASGVTELDELASRSGSNRDALGRLARHLVNQGIFTSSTGSSVGLTAVGEILRSGDPSGRNLAFHQSAAAPRFEAAVADLMHSVLTGEPSYARVHGEEFWQQLSKEPMIAAAFDSDMTLHARALGPRLVENYNWSGIGRIADVGGGSGELLRNILARLPRISGVVIEFADAARRARNAGVNKEVEGRYEVYEANFLEDVPAVADVYLLSWILHDWDDEPAAVILRNCRKALAEHGRILIIEKPYDIGRDSTLDLLMLAYFGGRERTRDEYEVLASNCGLKVASWTPLADGFYLMDCRPTDD